MVKNLVQSKTERQNILNNDFAIYEIEKQLNINPIIFDDEILFTKEIIAKYFEVDIRTIERYIEDNKEELIQNGYKVLRGEALKRLKKELNLQFGSDIYVGTKTTVLF